MNHHTRNWSPLAWLPRWIGACIALFLLCAAPAHAQSAPVPIKLSGTNLCLDISGGVVDNDAPAIIWTCHGDANQQWILTSFGTQYQLAASHSNKCLDIQYASTADNAPALQWTCSGTTNQRYTLRAQNGGYAIVAAHSGKCLAPNSAADGQAVLQKTCTGAVAQTWNVTIQQVTVLPSKWTSPITLPLVPAAAANLPNGRVLVWSAYDRFNFGGDAGQTYTAIFNPANNSSTEKLVTNTQHDMFCPGTANLPDGRILVNGGSSDAKTSIYNPSTNAWTTAAQMVRGRGYQGAATLSNGGVFTIGGSWSGNIGDKDGETWTSATGWRLNSAVWDDYILTGDAGGIYRSDNHAWLFAVSNGRVFHAGPSKQMNWIDTAGNGGVTSAGTRAADGDAMNGNAVLYDIGRIFTVGGAPDYENSNATANAHVIDIRTTTPTVRKVASMAYARAFHNSVVLPNGQIVVIGGQAWPVTFSDDGAVLVPELWDPATEKFSRLASMATPRTYHSVALLLPDGRVLSGGGGLCGSCATNHPNVEILTPPYLLNANGTAATRPTITAAPADAYLGTTIAVTATTGMQKFSLVRMSSVTHSVNNEQRRIPLNFTVGTSGEYQLQIPADPGIAVPGYYMLFAMNAAGVPSVASIVRVR
ncbi:RICIN domain-containing protein [Cupriavidus plantarum]|uniref:RICIN domain-containing protein n=1 Tax=Cupriavidus plantarum TaxID=942865 RepID=UPI001B029C84|nr:RICIN domain-containing protein [Cupriavidus plantarum]CAG2146526.1 hypothetical protein LMG26296_03988 [Cupriavidus plantarum]SMR86229.1 galactose oxidase [Cupriavidus plantarum]